LYDGTTTERPIGPKYQRTRLTPFHVRTRAGGGRKTPTEAETKDVTILDRYQNAAVAKVVAANWIDYLQLAKFNGDWKIVNVLWEPKPKDSAPPKWASDLSCGLA
jgi:hypothetical protein